MERIGNSDAQTINNPLRTNCSSQTNNNSPALGKIVRIRSLNIRKNDEILTNTNSEVGFGRTSAMSVTESSPEVKTEVVSADEFDVHILENGDGNFSNQQSNNPRSLPSEMNLVSRIQKVHEEVGSIMLQMIKQQEFNDHTNAKYDNANADRQIKELQAIIEQQQEVIRTKNDIIKQRSYDIREQSRMIQKYKAELKNKKRIIKKRSKEICRKDSEILVLKTNADLELQGSDERDSSTYSPSSPSSTPTSPFEEVLHRYNNAQINKRKKHSRDANSAAVKRRHR